MSSLSDAQLLQGLPIQTGEDTVDATKYLGQLASTVGSVPSSGYFLQSPVLVWQGCVPSGGTAPPTAAPTLDLEATAQGIIGPGARLFADVSQGTINMCTSLAFAQGYTLKYCLQQTREAFRAEGATVPQLSAVFAYYFQRVEECKTFGVCKCTLCAQRDTCTDVCSPPCIDCGSYLLSAATVFSNGVCISQCWPYSKAVSGDLDTPPDDAARANALAFRVPALTCITTDGSLPSNVCAALAAGKPVVAFINLTPAQVGWMQAQQLGSSGPPWALPMPAFNTQVSPSALVGHAVLIDGWYAPGRLFLVRNNFGLAWGSGGRFAISADSLGTPGQVHSAVELTRVCGPAPDKVSPTSTLAGSTCQVPL